MRNVSTLVLVLCVCALVALALSGCDTCIAGCSDFDHTGTCRAACIP